MTFVTAWMALAGVLAMAIPIAIHLLMRRRRQPVQWAAMRLLQQALRDRTRRLRLEHFMVLALRCLLLAALGAALAQPLLRGAGFGTAGSGRVVYLVIDDSLVSGRLDQNSESNVGTTTALERHRGEAERIIAALRSGDAVGIVAASRPGRGLLLPPTTDLAAATALLRSLEPSDLPADLPGALTALRESIDALDENRAVAAFLLCDFRRGSATLENPLAGSPAELAERDVHLIASLPAEDAGTNTQVTSIEPLRRLLLPEQGDGSGQVTVRLSRHGDLPAGSSEVRIDGSDLKAVAARSVKWSAGQSDATVDFTIEPAAPDRMAVGVVASVVHDALPADDRRYAVLKSRSVIRVVLLDRRGFGSDVNFDQLSGGQWIARALRPAESSPIDVTVEDPTRLQAAMLRAADAVVVARPDLLEDSGWAALSEALARGAAVLITPPGDATVHLWVDKLGSELGLRWSIALEAVEEEEGLALNERQPATALLRLLAGELPELSRSVRFFRRLAIEPDSVQGQVVLESTDGAPIVVSGAARRPDGTALPGPVVLLAAAPELTWTDLPAKPLMVPLIQEIVRQGVGLGTEAQSVLVGEAPILPPSAAELIPLEERRAPVAVSPREAPRIRHAGLLRVVDVAGQPIGLLGVNVEPPAGDTTPQPREAVGSWLKGSGPWSFVERNDFTAPLQMVEEGTSLAFVLLILALAVALFESVLARRFSHADRHAALRAPASVREVAA